MRKHLLRNLITLAVIIGLLFLPAGTLRWPQGWIFLALLIGCSLALGLWLRRTDPALLAERMKSPFSPDQALRDRLVMGAILLAFATWLGFMALDARRFAWSHVPPWAQWLGAVLILGAFIGWVAVLKANSFASVAVRLQPERGQRVISTGPYAVVRHPMYAFALLLMLGMPLLLGSLWGLFGVVLLAPLLAARVAGEEAMLNAGLPGYREYAARVRYRLLPGLW
jgi:protein-S-isoprenylcysteine O-methyltransferase Ste14